MNDLTQAEIARRLAEMEDAEARGEPLPARTYAKLRIRWFKGIGHSSLLSPAWKSHVPENRTRILGGGTGYVPPGKR